jgi:hypothetical protein
MEDTSDSDSSPESQEDSSSSDSSMEKERDRNANSKEDEKRKLMGMRLSLMESAFGELMNPKEKTSRVSKRIHMDEEKKSTSKDKEGGERRQGIKSLQKELQQLQELKDTSKKGLVRQVWNISANMRAELLKGWK